MRDTGKNLTEVLKAAFAVLGDIGKILAEALKGRPALATIVLLLVIAAVVTIIAAILFGAEVVFGFFALILVAIVGILALLFRTEVRNEKEQIRTPVGVTLNMSSDTVSLVDRLNSTQKQDILGALRGAAVDVADALHILPNLARPNLFGVDENNRMRILPGFTFNMNRQEELTISMPVGYGSTGRCFQNQRPNIAVFREGWDKDVIEDQELRKVHPDLQWIISVPIVAEGGKPIWVLNVDGLQERRPEGELRNALGRLFNWSQMISLIIAQG